jgi:hypothetical protein
MLGRTKRASLVGTSKAASKDHSSKVLRGMVCFVGVGVYGLDLGFLLARVYSKGAGGVGDGPR